MEQQKILKSLALRKHNYPKEAITPSLTGQKSLATFISAEKSPILMSWHLNLSGPILSRLTNMAGMSV